MRKKGAKNLNGEKPWEKYGLTRGCYYARMSKGLPLDMDLPRGRKPLPENLEIRRLKAEFGRRRKNWSGRASGRVYENPPGRLEEIRRKYAGGITEEIMSELEQKLKNGF